MEKSVEIGRSKSSSILLFLLLSATLMQTGERQVAHVHRRTALQHVWMRHNNVSGETAKKSASTVRTPPAGRWWGDALAQVSKMEHSTQAQLGGSGSAKKKKKIVKSEMLLDAPSRGGIRVRG